MIKLPKEHADQVSPYFQPEIPGPLVGMHVVNTACGDLWVDSWPSPHAILSRAGDNCSLLGDPTMVDSDFLQSEISTVILDAPPKFEPLLRKTFAEVKIWERVVYTLVGMPKKDKAIEDLEKRSPHRVALLHAENRQDLENLQAESQWIWNTWQDPGRLAKSGFARGAFVGGRLVSVAISFFVGRHFEDIGVVTDVPYRRRGLSVACVGALCSDIIDREKTPTWTTSKENIASRRLAEKIGFSLLRQDILYVINMDIPE